MKITRNIHACVSIASTQTTIIIDPGSFGVPENLELADAILFTHAHPDHCDQQKLIDAHLARPKLPIYGPKSLAAKLPFELHTIEHGDALSIGDLEIEVVGTKHAMTTHAQPTEDNVGYLIDGRVLHPGDAFQSIKNVELALVPVNGPWLKMLDIEAWLKKFPPQRFAAIHDGIANERGLAINHKFLTLLAEKYGSTFLPLGPGDALEI